MKAASDRMEKIVSLCKRRGFIFQSSEIYGGLNGVWDYGPLGVELKNNLKQYWWRVIVHERDDVVGIDGSILTHPAVLKASGHEDTFNDPMSTCRYCKRLLRADQIWSAIEESDWYDALAELFALGKLDTPNLKRWAETKGRRDAPNLAIVRNFPVTLSWLSEHAEASGALKQLTMKEFVQYLATEQFNQTGLVTPCPHCGGDLTQPAAFNLMLKTNLGAKEDDASLAYLRPETAQSIFVQFKNVLDTSRKKLPFGIAQIGKAFRNEINPRNFTFRSREFEQMELEYFCRPEQGMDLLAYWLKERLKFYQDIGIGREHLHVLDVPDAERAFYSKGTFDIEYEFPFGRQELEGVAYRTDYDLMQHQTASGKSLEYFDEETKQKFVPHVVEPSAGVDRTVLALICEAYAEDEAPDEKGKMESRICAAISSTHGAGEMRRVPAFKKQGAARGEGEGNCGSTAPAHECVLRREWCHRATLSAPGRNRHAVWHDGGFRDARRKRRRADRHCHVARTRFDETGTRENLANYGNDCSTLLRDVSLSCRA